MNLEPSRFNLSVRFERRRWKIGREANEETLRTKAVAVVSNEGYEVDLAQVEILP
jgi:hypothetical protein